MDVDEKVALVRRCILWVLEEDSWQSIGFRSRPKRGRLLDWTAPKWKRELESRIRRELTLFCLFAELKGENSPDEDIQSIPLTYSLALEKYELLSDFSYMTTNEASASFFDVLNSYYDANASDWHMILTRNLQLDLVRDQKMRQRISAGAIRLCAGLSYNLDAIQNGNS